MAIEITCERGKQFRAKDEYAGRRAVCPACKRELIIEVQSVRKPEARTERRPIVPAGFELVEPKQEEPPPASSRSCETGGVGNAFSRGNCYVTRLGLHYISRSGLSRSGILSFRAARILACSGLGRATRCRATFLPSVVSGV